MKKILLPLLLIGLVAIASCNSKPSDEDIQKKLLGEYVCGDNAKLISFKILHSKKSRSFTGEPAYEYLVSGEIQWISDCPQFFNVIPAGYKESFKNKKIFLYKGEDGWE